MIYQENARKFVTPLKRKATTPVVTGEEKQVKEYKVLTEEQEIKLANLYKENYDVLEGNWSGQGRDGGGVSNKDKNKKWKNITTSVNALGGVPHTYDDLRRKCKRMIKSGNLLRSTFVG